MGKKSRKVGGLLEWLWKPTPTENTTTHGSKSGAVVNSNNKPPVIPLQQEIKGQNMTSNSMTAQRPHPNPNGSNRGGGSRRRRRKSIRRKKRFV
jgi:hypothetical protein